MLITSGAYVRVRDFVENLPAEGDAIAGYTIGGRQYRLTGADLLELVENYGAAVLRPGRQPQVGGPDDSFAMVAEDEPGDSARSIVEHWFSHAALISDSVGSPEWKAVAGMTRRVLDLMDTEEAERQAGGPR